MTPKKLATYIKSGSAIGMDSSRELLIIAGLLAFALVVGALTGAFGWTLLGAIVIWVAIQMEEFRKVFNWSRRPLRRPENGLDSWFALAYPPYRALQRERQRSRNIAARLREVLGLAEVIPDAVIILSPNGDIEGMNNAAKELLQLTDADLGIGLGTVVRSPDFVDFIKADSHEESLEFASPFDQDQSFEARRFDTDAGRRIVLVRDITTLNRLLTMRQNFVANVSHELRTPLTVVAGYLETMRDPEQPDELRLSLVDRLDRPLRRMQSLVDDLLLLTQLESTSAAEAQHPLRLNHVIQSAVAELQPLCTKPDQVEVSSDTEHAILGVETELYSVCVNLLSNALRYSPEGRKVEIKLSDHGDKVRLAFKDHGFGIAPEHLSRLTERFYRVDMAGARSRGGTGLGLAIVKHVLRRHGSELQIDSTLGEGSTFYCDFERAPTH